MNRNEFVIATAIVLMLAFTLGWFAHLVVQRLRFKPATDAAGTPVPAPFYWRQRWF